MPWIAAGVGAVVLIGGIGIFAATRGGGEDQNNASEGSESSETVAQSQENSASSEPSTTETGAPSGIDSVSGIVDRLPKGIQDQVENCKGGSAAMSGAMVVDCDVKKNDTTDKYFQNEEDYLTDRLSFSVDDRESRSKRAEIRDYKPFDDDEKVTGPEYSSDQNAVANALSRDKLTPGALNYANIETGLVITSNDFQSPEAAMKWVKDQDLL